MALGRPWPRLGGALRLLDQALDRRRHLRAVPGPVLDAIEGDAQRLLAAGGDRVVEADALDEAPVATQARIGDDDVEEGALLRAATCKPDHDHGGIPVAAGAAPRKTAHYKLC